MDLDLQPRMSEVPVIQPTEDKPLNQGILTNDDAIMRDMDPKSRIQNLQSAMGQTEVEQKFLCYQAEPDLIEISREREQMMQ